MGFEKDVVLIGR